MKRKNICWFQVYFEKCKDLNSNGLVLLYNESSGECRKIRAFLRESKLNLKTAWLITQTRASTRLELILSSFFVFSSAVARGYYCCLVVELKQVFQAVWKIQNSLKLKRKHATVLSNYEADELFNFISFEHASTEFCNVSVRKKILTQDLFLSFF